VYQVVGIADEEEAGKQGRDGSTKKLSTQLHLTYFPHKIYVR